MSGRSRANLARPLAQDSSLWRIARPRDGGGIPSRCRPAPATKAPADDAALALARFNCTACHERDGSGGLTPEYINRLGTGEDGASELVTPPSLTQVTAKLTEKALRGVLEGDERSRPWMSLQMPHFGKQRVADLPVQLAALDATKLDARAPKRPRIKIRPTNRPIHRWPKPAARSSAVEDLVARSVTTC